MERSERQWGETGVDWMFLDLATKERAKESRRDIENFLKNLNYLLKMHNGSGTITPKNSSNLIQAALKD